MMSNALWFSAVAIGPVILGAVIFYAMMKSRRLTPRERQDRHEAINDLYKGPDGPR